MLNFRMLFSETCIEVIITKCIKINSLMLVVTSTVFPFVVDETTLTMLPASSQSLIQNQNKLSGIILLDVGKIVCEVDPDVPQR